MKIGVIIIGDELLTGRRQDKHLSHTINTLAHRGLELAWARYCGDDEILLSEEFRHIHESNDVCFSFGGIGATHDDKTRQAVASALRVSLEQHPDAVREIVAKFGQDSYPYRVLMADLPQGASIIPNPYNRIPGFSVDHIHCLPGFPQMAWPMLEWVLDNLYPQLTAEPPVQLILTLPDAYESKLIDLMSDFQNRHPSVKLSSLPRFLSQDQRELELGLRGQRKDVETAHAELKSLLESQAYRFTENSSE
ncbi:MAG: competence/damage-inducible protein A [Gammaproteobacteria bacterium]